MKNKWLIIVGIAISVISVFFLGFIIVIVTSFTVVLGAGGSSSGDFDGYLFKDLPFLADYYTCTSDFGKRDNPTGAGISYHKGIDLVAFKKDGTKGVPIVSVFDGVVVHVTYASSGSGAGNSIEVYDKDLGIYVRYMHMYYEPNFKEKEYVKKGDVLGIQGTTGNSTGVHLHFEMYIQNGENKELVNPRTYFDFPEKNEYRKIDNSIDKNKKQEVGKNE